MSIEQTDKVDAFGVDKITKECVLTISDHLDWSADTDHYLLLQEKINTYLAFIDSGEILEAFPNAKDKKIRIDVVFKYEPTDTKTLDLLKIKLSEMGFGFSTRHLQTDN